MVDELEADLRNWLIGEDFPEDIELTAMRPGLGSTQMWSFRPAPESSALVVRMFGEGAGTGAEREFLAMEAATRHGVPVPAIVTRGTVSGRPFLVTSFVPGATAIQVLEAHPERAQALGVMMGEALGRVHEVAAPAGLSETAHAWIDLGGPSLANVRRLLDVAPDQNRLLHLDYHPHNVLVDDDRISGIIDWENTLAGPPHMDLARTRAILRAAVLGDLAPTQRRQVLEQFADGLVAGHARVIGEDPFPELSAAWGLAMTVEDLSSQAAKPGSPISQALVTRLADERDALIQRLGSEETPDR